MSSDRNLLVGILAVQLNFATKEQLVEAMNKWLLQKQTPLAELLPLDAESRQLLEALVAKHLALHGDDPQKSLAALSSVDSVKAAMAEVHDHDVQASLGYFSTGTIRQTTPHYQQDASLRFRVIRPHARGALGEVFVAEDTELHRQVALKEIQSQHAHDANSKGRFILEAEVTGGLEHPNIVPVYGLGTYKDGRPFYAMRFIKGDSFKDAIDHYHRTKWTNDSEKNLAFRNMLKRFIDVCNAMAYAHARGVLHRDLKPGNIMLGKYGETLVVDWGLAKPLAATRSGAGVSSDDITSHTISYEDPLAVTGSSYDATQQGSRLGTPAFMSPEQAKGELDKLGPVSDVYSLGATLYVLLTGKLPFSGDLDEILRKVIEGDFNSPKQLTSGVAAALNAVTLKAMAKKPSDRYVNAEFLAAEVEQFLADEPVSSYVEPLSMRAKRWTRKHPGTVAGLAATLIVGLLGLGGGLYFVNVEKDRTEEQRRAAVENEGKANDAKAEETRQKTIAQQNEIIAKNAFEQSKRDLEVAKAVRSFLQVNILRQANPWQRLKPNANAKTTNANELTLRSVLDEAAKQYSPGNIEKIFPTQPDTVVELLDTLAETYEGLGDSQRAILFRIKAIDVRDANYDKCSPETVKLMVDLAFSQLRGASLSAVTDTLVAVLNRYEDSLVRLQAGQSDVLIDAMLKALEKNFDTADSTLPLIGPSIESLKVAGTLTLVVIPKLKRIHERVSAKHGENDKRSIIVSFLLAAGQYATGNASDAVGQFESINTRAATVLPREHPMIDALREVLCACYLLNNIHRDRIISMREASYEINMKKYGIHPVTIINMKQLADAYESVFRLDEAIALYEQAQKHSANRLGHDHWIAMNAMFDLANCYQYARKNAEAISLFQELVRIQCEKTNQDHHQTLFYMNFLGLAFQAAYRMDEAIPLFETTLVRRRAVLKATHYYTLQSMSNLADAYRLAGRLSEAIPLSEETLKLKKKLLKPHDGALWASINNMALAYNTAGRPNDALPHYREALKIKLKYLDPDNASTIVSMNNLAYNCLSTGNENEAIQLYGELNRIMEARKYQHEHAPMCMQNIVDAYLQQGLYQQAETTQKKWMSARKSLAGEDRTKYLLELDTMYAIYHHQRKWPEAESVCRECLALSKRLVPNSRMSYNIESMLGESLAKQSNNDEAEKLLLSGFEGLKMTENRIPPGNNQLREAIQRLVDFYTETKQPEKAKQWQAKLPKEFTPMPRKKIDIKPMTYDEVMDQIEKRVKERSAAVK